jgi:branched-chain amino acid transport system substrate-binding protein
MIKKIFSFAWMGLIVFALVSCKKQDATLNIGFSGPLTGDAASYGKLMSQAVQLAIDERNESGGIGEKIKLKMIAEDDEGKAEKATLVLEKMSNVDHIVGLVGAVFSGCSLAIAPKCEQSQIVMISPSSTHKLLTSMGKYIFRDCISDELQSRLFAKYVKEKLEYNNVAILHLKNDYSQGLADDFKIHFEQDGGKIVAMESGLQGDKDFKTQLTKIWAKRPDAIFIPGYINEMAHILQQGKEMGITTQWLSSDGFSNPEIFSLAGDLANGVVFSNSPEESSLINTKKNIFEKKYITRFKQKPDSFSLNSYDAANILMDAMQFVYNEASPEDQRSANLNPAKIRNYVADLQDYSGVSGKITFMPNRDVLKNIAIFKVENKEFVQQGVFLITRDALLEVVE